MLGEALGILPKVPTPISPLYSVQCAHTTLVVRRLTLYQCPAAADAPDNVRVQFCANRLPLLIAQGVVHPAAATGSNTGPLAPTRFCSVKKCCPLGSLSVLICPFSGTLPENPFVSESLPQDPLSGCPLLPRDPSPNQTSPSGSSTVRLPPPVLDAWSSSSYRHNDAGLAAGAPS